MTRILTPLLFLCQLSALALAADWSQFRGADGQGHGGEVSLPTEWSPEKNIAWKVEVPGEGWSSPVVHQGRIYLTAAVPVDEASEDRSLKLFCLDGKSGETIWSTEIFLQSGETAPRIHSKNSHASPTPLIHDGHIYVHFGHQGTASVDLDGKIVWKGKPIDYRPVHGNGGSPVVFDDLLIFSTDGAKEQKLNALNRHAGELVWQTKRGIERPKKFAFCTPLIIDVDGQPQVVSPGAGMVGGYNPRTGEEIWRVEYDGYSVVPRPVYGHGLVFISTSFDSPTVLAIHPTGKGNVTETHVAWTHKRGAPHSPSMLLDGDELFMVSDRGVATCVDAKSGEMHWQERLGGKYSASLIHAGGKIYALSEEGVGIVFAAQREFREIARNELGERTLASCGVIDNDLLIRTDKSLYRIHSPE